MGPVIEERYGIVQFAGSNFSNWKFRVEVFLRKHGVKQCLTDSTPIDPTKAAEFKGKDAIAIALLVQCIAGHI